MPINLAPAVPAGIITAVLSTACTVPYITVEYRRHGLLRPATTLRRLCVLGYGTSLLCFVLLPLPGKTVTCRTPRWTPFTELAANSAAGTAQLLCNIALFLPLGVLLRRAGTSTSRAALFGLGCSLAIELTQLTGNWGTYPCAYRVFDVEDLLANTAGAWLGARLLPRGGALPPDDRQSHTHRLRPTVLHHVLGRCCDLAGLWWFGSGLLVAARPLLPAGFTNAHPQASTALEVVACWFAPGVAILLCTAGTGATPGQHMVRLHRAQDARHAAVRCCTSVGALALCQGVAALGTGQGGIVATCVGHLLHAGGPLLAAARHRGQQTHSAATEPARRAHLDGQSMRVAHNRTASNTNTRGAHARVHRRPNNTDR